MMSIQIEIDKLSVNLGADHQSVRDLKNQFEKLSQTELKKQDNLTINNIDLSLIKSDTEQIRHHLSIRGNYSINYDFITNKIVKNQLYKDNLRMENCRLEISTKTELERFYEFCVNAFYQIEQLVNYYYGRKYPNFLDLVKHLESLTYKDYKSGELKTIFKKGKEKSISDIVIATKIFAFKVEFFNQLNDFTGKNIDELRKVRNEGLHRCEIIKQNINEDRQIFIFFKNNTFDTTFSVLEKLKIKIEMLLKNNNTY